MSNENAECTLLTGACSVGEHDNCAAWLRPFQLASTPCDCDCHEQTAKRSHEGEGTGDWECYGCLYRMESLLEGFDTKCPMCGSYEIHLTDEAKRHKIRPIECNHPGGFRADTGEWECSPCGKRFPSYEAWGEATGNNESVLAVKAAIEADLAEMEQDDRSEDKE